MTIAFSLAADVRLLDPSQVQPSRYHGRQSQAFGTARFRALKESIARDGCNAVPVLVRRSEALQPRPYELAYGVMRTQACLELGLPVLAIVQLLGDVEMVVRMFRENEGTVRISPFEQGLMYERVLRSRLFPTARRLADQLGTSLTSLRAARQLATLPDPVLAAFANPLDLKIPWGRRLAQSFERNPELVAGRAALIVSSQGRLNAISVYRELSAHDA